MVRARPLTLFFKDIDKEDIPSVGGKGANLGEMAGAGFPVPAGFAVTVSAYDRFLEENDLPLKIKKILDSLDVNNPEELNKASKDIQKIIKNSKIPSDVATEIISAYKKLSGLFKEALVAVRSSATAEDLPKASFAGQQATFLNTKGDTNLLIYVRECWASLFTPRSIFYRVENKIPHEIVKISVIVQKMIQSEASGVIFTIDPVTNEKDRIVIEAVWGLGEMIVQGSVVPDKYVVQKDTFLILSKEISDQPIELTRVGATTKEREVPLAKKDKQKISDEEIVKLARIANQLHTHYFFPQDIEWAKEGKNLYIVQTRPITTTEEREVPLAKKDKQKISDEEIVKLARIAAKLHAHYFFPQDIEWAKEGKNLYIVQTRPITTTDNANAKITKEEEKKLKMEKSPILVGAPASPGIGTGIVKILESAKEINKIHQGDVLVTSMTSPDFVPAMKKASAIVTDKGGQTSHAAIVSRELGIPCVVGCENATAKLREGMVITVDGAKGEVYLGSRTIKEVKIKVPQAIIHAKTATKIYVNLAEVERAGEVAKLNVDGVGLLRAEFMIAGIGIHPKEAIKRKEQGRFIEKLANSLEVFCKAFNPRPVVYRATDFKTNEYRALPGGKFWEPEEPNPMLGFRGAFRYIASPEVFNLELQAIKKVREKYSNLHLMIPYVRSPEELSKVRRIVSAEGLFESASFKFWMMVEIPVNVILIDDFIKVGIDGVSIGSNDLTMLIEGTDRDNSEVAQAFNERSEAVYWALKKVITTCNKYGVTSSICGQAPSEYDDLVEKLIGWGITSVSINPDVVDRVKSVVVQAERKIVG